MLTELVFHGPGEDEIIVHLNNEEMYRPVRVICGHESPLPRELKKEGYFIRWKLDRYGGERRCELPYVGPVFEYLMREYHLPLEDQIRLQNIWDNL